MKKIDTVDIGAVRMSTGMTPEEASAAYATQVSSEEQLIVNAMQNSLQHL